jgi:hypothetical protein
MGIEASNQTRTGSRSIPVRKGALMTVPFSTTIRRWQLGGMWKGIGDRFALNFDLDKPLKCV